MMTRIRLDVFLHYTLGGFAKVNEPLSLNARIIHLYRQGMRPIGIGARVNRSGNYVSTVLSQAKERPRFHTYHSWRAA